MDKTRIARQRRQTRVRRRVRGSEARPRLCVFRSNKHTYAQVISDETGRTLVAASTLEVEAGSGNKAAARKVGERIAELCKAQRIDQVVFDRNGFLFHGRVKEVAEGARAAGLQF
ncbi:50S ribosomal protein L18 [bacterium]|nr:50S ribosomal protein L18 [bacterium]